ncbi:MAG TPA: hypothetical protein VGF70_14590 [Solirubrobacteraceae bacterium]
MSGAAARPARRARPCAVMTAVVMMVAAAVMMTVVMVVAAVVMMAPGLGSG